MKHQKFIDMNFGNNKADDKAVLTMENGDPHDEEHHEETRSTVKRCCQVDFQLVLTVILLVLSAVTLAIAINLIHISRSMKMRHYGQPTGKEKVALQQQQKHQDEHPQIQGIITEYHISAHIAHAGDENPDQAKDAKQARNNQNKKLQQQQKTIVHIEDHHDDHNQDHHDQDHHDNQGKSQKDEENKKHIEQTQKSGDRAKVVKQIVRKPQVIELKPHVEQVRVVRLERVHKDTGTDGAELKKKFFSKHTADASRNKHPEPHNFGIQVHRSKPSAQRSRLLDDDGDEIDDDEKFAKAHAHNKPIADHHRDHLHEEKESEEEERKKLARKAVGKNKQVKKVKSSESDDSSDDEHQHHHEEQHHKKQKRRFGTGEHFFEI